MDTTDPKIAFDSEGRCNHCREYEATCAKLVYQGPTSDAELKALAQVLKKQSKGAPYDCVIGLSGGIDSSYVCYISKQLGLRPLAVHLDNGWNSEEAVRNIKNICSQLEIDYQSYVLNWNDFRQIQLAFLRASIVEAEIPTDVAIVGALHRVAAQHRVPFILSGGNLATEAIMPRSWFYYPKDSKLFRAICRRFGARRIQDFPTFDYWEEIYYKFVRGIRLLYPLNYVPYSRELAQRTLIQQLDWKDYGGKHHESRFTKFVQNYLQPVKFNVDYRRATFSTQICQGALTREAALEQLAQLPYDPARIEDEKSYVAKKLNISAQDLEEILRFPCKSYQDYPNNEKLLRFLYGAYRKLFKTTRSFHNTGYE